MNISPPSTETGSARWLRSRASALTAALLAVLLLAGTSFLLERSFDGSEKIEEAVRQSYERTAQLQEVLSLHKDLETGERGYVVTSNTRFLEPYWSARSRLRTEMGTLDKGWPDTDEFHADLALLGRLSAEKLSFVERNIALEKSGAHRAAIDMIRTGEGKRIMDSIRVVIGRMDRLEHARLDQRIAWSRSAAREAKWTSAILQLLLVVLLIVAARVAERSLAERKRALGRFESANARQAAIFNAATDGIIVLNGSGSIESLNPAAARMYGYAPDSLVRRDVGILFEVAPDQGRVETFLKRLQRRASNQNGKPQEFWGRRSDGSAFPGEVTLAPVEMAGGARYVAVVRDISERKQVETMKTEFVSTVSHELRTPLTSIAGSLGLLAGGATGSLPAPAARLVEVARDNCQRLIRLINDILDIEKIESGQMRFDIVPVELAPLLTMIVDANSGFAREHQVRLVLGVTDPSIAALADADALAQVVTNLISNAVKFSPAGKAVRIDVSRLDRRVRISVSDRGSGIPEGFRARIFEKFAQADSTDARRNGGTGLGLSIVREIVTRLGGTIGFEDREGGGTCFNVDIPVAASARGPEADAPAQPRILQVEDDPDVIELTSRAFAGRACLHHAVSLAEAREMLGSESFDAVILDLTLPDGSGAELLRDLGRRGDAPPVLVFSAEESDPAETAGAAKQMVKARASLNNLVQAALSLASAGERDAA